MKTFPLLASLTSLLLLAALPVQAENIFPRVFAGGVSGISALQTSANSDSYRANGGGVYLHHSGWSPLSTSAKDAIQANFAAQDFTVEIGYSNTDPGGWVATYLANYHNRGIRPAFITCNCFADDNLPTATNWTNWINAFRNAGIDGRTLILPTFEYANFSQNIATLSSNKVSQRADFQNIITLSGGIVLDTPSNYFFLREQAYRDWVVDAIQWVRSHGMTAVVIMSPHTAGTNYDEQSSLYVTYLKDNGALPNMYVVENYSTQDPATYLNIVGSEDIAHQQLGCARLLQNTWLPGAVGRASDYDGDGKIASEEQALGRSDNDVSDLAFDFDTAANLEGWTNFSNISNLAVSGGRLTGKATTGDPNLWKTGFYFDGGHIKNLLVFMKASAAGSVQLYWGANGGGFTGANQVTANYTTANTWQVLSFPMSSSAAWKNQAITSLRIDPISVTNATFEIDWIVGSEGDWDHDTYTDTEEGFADTNTDGVPNAFDIDSDGDSISDQQERIAGKSPTLASDMTFSFSSAGNFEGWTANNISNYTVASNFLNGLSSTSDPMLTHTGFWFKGTSAKKIQVYMKATAASTVQLFWGIAGDNVFTGTRVKSAAYTTANAWQLVTFDMSADATWTAQTIQSLRIDPVNANGVTFNIDHILAQP